MANSTAPQNTTALATGFGIGILWLLMAATCIWTAVRGWANDRPDWALLWGMVGFLMAAAGIAAMVGTWWHLTRVTGREH